MRDDMVPRNNRSIRDIPVPSHPKKRLPPLREPAHTVEEDYMERPVTRTAPPRRRKGRRWFLISAITVVILCAVGGLLLSTLFAGATITVFPRTEQVSAPKTLIAKTNPATGELGFQVMTVTRSASTTVPATGTHEVSRSASGLATVYNAYGTDPQRLIANTRFAAPDGKIYRIRDSITVPGAVKNSDNTLTPGAVTVTLYADSPGAAYNRTDTRFTIPGFKDDPRYDKFYAQAIAISGGFVGTEPAVATNDLNQAADLIKQGLSQAAQASLASQVPPGYIAIPGSLQISFGELTQTPGQGNSATVAQTATMSGDIIRVADLAMAVAQQMVQDYHAEPVAFADVSALSIATATSTNQASTITLMLSGTPTLVWQFDPATLKAALIGKSKSTFQSIVESFAPAISRAEAKVRPFWERSFPSDPDKITVIVGTQ
jgi:hypothetical protein